MHWDIQVFRGVKRFSDYKKAKARIRRALDTNANVRDLRGWKRARRSLLSNRGLTIIIAMGTVVLVLLAIATLIAMLLLYSGSGPAPTGASEIAMWQPSRYSMRPGSVCRS